MRLLGTMRVNDMDNLEIGGCDAVILAKKYGTPLYVFDTALIRERCASYTKTFKSSKTETEVIYASKAFLTLAMCRLIDEAGLSLDVVSGGELFTAMTANFPPERLFFHGNGEIVADYNDLAPMYNEMGINFLAADYRGYGRSNGKPTITAMMRDCHIIFDYVKTWLIQHNYPGPFILMGRSVGSASVLELAAHYENQVDGLIVESGFAYASPLLRLLGIDLQAIGFTEEKGFRNIDKISRFEKPTLIIHAEFDHIISFSEGQALYDACSSNDKILLKIPAANHNDIFMRGMPAYMAAIKKITDQVKQP